MSGTQTKDPQQIQSVLEDDVNTADRTQIETMPSVWQEM